MSTHSRWNFFAIFGDGLATREKRSGTGASAVLSQPRRPCHTWMSGIHHGLLAILVVGSAASVTQAGAGGVAASLLPSQVDAGVPTPSSVIGHAVGQGAARYADVVRYMRALDEASPLVGMTEYGRTHEGRSLYYVTITSAANWAKLAEIKADNASLADPRKLGSVRDADRIMESLPGVAWLAYSIHGDEMSGTDASMLVAYALAAGTDEARARLREQLVIHIDPSMNPDGRERYLSQLEPLRGKVPSTDHQSLEHSGNWSSGRGNHYLFDLNRDWLMQVHPETRGRTAAILEWNPHLVIDAHEMGSLDTYLFDPPREPYNVNLSESNMKWRRRFSADQAGAFDRHGWSYYTQEWYEEWYPGYTNAWANLLGAVGILYEQASLNGGAVKQASGVVATYDEAVAHQYASSMANLESLRANRAEILRDYYDDKRWQVTGADAGEQRLFVAFPGRDEAKLARFVDLLTRHGIEHRITAAAGEVRKTVSAWGEKAESVPAPAGAVVVELAQPRRRLLRSILEFDPRMTDKFLHEERKQLENREGTKLYDVTAWNLPMAYGLEAYWAEGISEGGDKAGTPAAVDPFAKRSAYGYLIDGGSSDIYQAVVRLLDRGCKIRLARKPFASGKKDSAAGALLLRNHENPAELGELLRASIAGLRVEVRAAESALSDSGPDLGGQEFALLQTPRVAIASQWPISTTSFGSVWQLLDDRLGLRCSPINAQSLGRIDLRNYNVLVLPEAFGGGLSAILHEGARGQLRAWLEAGGTLIALGSSAAFVAGKDNNLSAVRLRPDVLDKLAVYEEAVSRERAARAVQVDPAVVWGDRPAGAGAGGADAKPSDGADKAKPEGDAKERAQAGEEKAASGEKKGSSGGDVEALKRKDAWLRVFSPSGAFVRAEANPEHWLAFGVGERLAVLFGGSNVFMSAYPVSTPVRLAPAEKLRLSGLMWPEARERMADSAYATVERVGNGQIILFADDPTFRGYLEGSNRLFLNAVIFGPGAGTDSSVPW